MYDLALNEYNQALRINSDYPNVNYAIGVIYEKMGDTSNAKIYFQKELEVNPLATNAQNALNSLNNSQ